MVLLVAWQEPTVGGGKYFQNFQQEKVRELKFKYLLSKT
jgi:hypothetical protein